MKQRIAIHDGGRMARAAAVLVLLAATVSAAEGRTIRVPADAKTVTDAVERSAAGDTVLVSPGLYSHQTNGERFSLRISNPIVILGVGDPDSVIITPDYDRRRAQTKLKRLSEVNAFTFFNLPEGTKAVVRGITFKRSLEVETSGIIVYKGSVEVENCRFRDITTGVRVLGGGKAHVSRCRVEGCEMGLSTLQGDVEFEDNDISQCRLGINIEYARGYARDNRISESTVDGIALNNSTDVIVEGNRVELSERCGVSLRYSGGVLRGNELTGNRYGVWCSQESTPHIVRNVFRDNHDYDVGCEALSAPLVGGSLPDANDFAGGSEYLVFNTTDRAVDCNLNFWGSDCPSEDRFNGPVTYKPWTDEGHANELVECP